MAPKNFASSREEIMGEIPNLERSQEERELNYEEICKLQSLMAEIQQIFKKEEIVWGNGRELIGSGKGTSILPFSTKVLVRGIKRM